MILCVAGLVLSAGGHAYAQKYTFSHYDIEDGLLQSQVNKLYQDNAHRLWIATLGGACRFDGKEYEAITKANGLVNNFIYQVFVDKSDKVWFGTHKGLASLERQKVYNYPVPPNEKNAWVQDIVQDGRGTIWILMNSHLYSVNGHMLHLSRSVKDTITCLAVDKAGALYATLYKKGVFRLNKNGWESYIPFTGSLCDSYIVKMVFDKQDRDKSYLLSYRQLFVASGENIKPYPDPVLGTVKEPLMCLAQDGDGNLWVGTTNGAYYLNKQNTVHFTASNGFTDNAVSDIYNDGDNNLWFGTEGTGVFKFEGDSYVIFDHSQGINNGQIVMGIARDKYDNIILGTDGSGLVKYNDGKFTPLLPLGEHSERRIQCLYTDKDKNLWIGTGNVGVWKYDGKNFTQLKGIEERSIGALSGDDDGTLWVGTAFGCYYYKNNILKKLAGVNTFVTSFLQSGKDTVLLGTQAGVMLVINKKLVSSFKLNTLGTSAIYCMLKVGGNVLFGTDDKGLFSWDRKSNRLRNYSVKDGFNSNSIYSLVADKYGIIWVGSGRGVKRISVNVKSMVCTLLPNSNSKELIVEANQNAALTNGDKVIIATTRGLIVYNAGLNSSSSAAPYTVIKSVKLFTNGVKQRVINENIDNNLKLASNENHLSISFLGVYLKNPQGVTYQYKLTGLDDKFCWPMKNNEVNYPSLPPGKYTFEVKAISPEGLISANVARFNFEIIPPFYKTTLFMVAVIVFFIFLGILLQSLWYRHKIQRQQAISTMRREEKLKIRQQTAEDFHDDLGNKLTRITILSEILNAKIDSNNTDQISLVEQIKQNAAALYNGTKDILWALDPQSDNLFETLAHIEGIGIELFHDTQVTFKFNGITESLKAIKLPMEYSRNITMIFKELLNNALKHAEANNVIIEVNTDEKDRICVALTDDGKGFDYDSVTRGRGLNNIKARATRIGAELRVYPESGIGTRAELKFKKNHKL